MMGRMQTYVCMGRHRIMVRQAHKPKGWRQDYAVNPHGDRVLVWFCPTCAPPAPRENEGGNDV